MRRHVHEYTARAVVPRHLALQKLIAASRTMRDLIALILDAVDESLFAAWRAFSFGVASAIGEQISMAANAVLKPLLVRVRSLLGQAWREWMAIAVVGLLLRALRNAYVGLPRQWRKPASGPLVSAATVHRPAYVHAAPTYGAQRPPPIHVDGGTWHFVPHATNIVAVDDDAAANSYSPTPQQQPLMLTFRPPPPPPPHSRL